MLPEPDKCDRKKDLKNRSVKIDYTNKKKAAKSNPKVLSKKFVQLRERMQSILFALALLLID